MVSGAFKSIRHEHIFEDRDGQTIVIDVFNYVSPLGILGKLADVLFLKRYLGNVLVQRNNIIKEYAENILVKE